jgi:Glyoxalase-like domain
MSAMPSATTAAANRRRLPVGDEIFLDHVGHFVRDAQAADRALRRAGFAPTPVSIQADKDPSTGRLVATGTGNITAMFARGYMEVQFKTSDSPLAAELEAALARRAGLHLAAFAAADAAAARERLAGAGFPVRDLVRMQRPVETETGPGIAAFTISRVKPTAMPEGRIQILTHHTEDAVWQPRWLSHPNSVCDLIDVVIAVSSVDEAVQRFARFTDRPPMFMPGGALIRLDRGGIYLVSHDRAIEKLPEVPVTSLPFMIGYALGVESLAAAEAAIDGADLEWRAFEDGIVATFPAELGQGAWFFVEAPEGLPWRR